MPWKMPVLAAALVLGFASQPAHSEPPLGDRVLVMQPNPGHITLDLPRPRDRASQRFTEIRQQIFRDMGAVAALAA
jgi:hypothetical protein